MFLQRNMSFLLISEKAIIFNKFDRDNFLSNSGRGYPLTEMLKE